MLHKGSAIALALWLLGFLNATNAEPRIHFAPFENLERIDVALIRRARSSIDLAAYVLTDVAVIEALAERARSGVALRILLYAGQIYDRPGSRPATALRDLQATSGVEIRVKPEDEPLMHLKAYQVDGRWLRTGSANFTASGLKHQDNDLVILDTPSALTAFQDVFETLWLKNAKR
jgi:phosphatidylserine/phosphatidylglycerophosphate/cardiolipin synthase-like enzyme